MRCIEKWQEDFNQTVKEKLKSTEKQAEDLIKELEQEIEDLTNRSSELKLLPQTKDHLNFLQGFRSLKDPPPTRDWTTVEVRPQSYVGTLRGSLDQLEETLNMEMKKLREVAELKRVQQYEVVVTLDPDTAHPCLTLSDDGKQTDLLSLQLGWGSRLTLRQRPGPVTHGMVWTQPVGEMAVTSGRRPWRRGRAADDFLHIAPARLAPVSRTRVHRLLRWPFFAELLAVGGATSADSGLNRPGTKQTRGRDQTDLGLNRPGTQQTRDQTDPGPGPNRPGTQQTRDSTDPGLNRPGTQQRPRTP
ncbi:unnamed protein product [Gadus morhua 'NCC']